MRFEGLPVNRPGTACRGTVAALVSFMLSQEITETAASLALKINGIQPAILRHGQEVFPAFALFTIQASNAAHGATFSVAIATLSPATLAGKMQETVTKFEEAK